MKVRFGDFLLDTDSRQLFRHGSEVRLQRKTYDLLELLARNRPKAMSKKQIRDELWPDTAVADASLTVAVAELRAALGDDAKEPRFLRTVYGFGYAFAGAAAHEGAGPTGPGSSASGLAPRVLWEKRIIPLVEGENVLGRDEGVAVRIDAPGVSRRHACIRVSGDRATIEDLGSKNGTYLGEAAETISAAVPLADDSRFRLGRVLLVFRTSPERGSTLTERRS
ncbi:MAG TPA: winged helix-turn-helix domain-containing protein [Vicinamibacteria bacterium]|nr:winged helix-turn-helix domain-containing protein [Vicinamibacteria bacterium]